MRYFEELFAQKTPYLQWLKTQGTDNNVCYGKCLHRLPFYSCMDGVGDAGTIRSGEILLFVRDGGLESVEAESVLSDVFDKNHDAVLAYADEDYRAGIFELYGIRAGDFPDSVTASYRLAGTGDFRGAPWFKPDFSPDTLASFFYIGSMFAARSDAVLDVMEKYGRGISIYEIVYRIFMRTLSEGADPGNRVVHVPKVLYTNDSLDEETRLYCSERIKGLHSSHKSFADEASDKITYGMSNKISIVIPSKDNADILGKCLGTLTKYTKYGNYEIIIVDNGSSREQRLCVEGMLDALREKNTELSVKYTYEKAEFNFSAMCNMGAAESDGEYLLFLNDDIEVMEDGGGWLEKMLTYAAKSHVGAVGAKLHYPNIDKNGCYIMQHAGITNMGTGPAHKLAGLADEGCIYHGHNTMNYDMMAVTAACMMVRRGVFEEAGGFDMSFPMAYNDVEFCFRLHEKGYFNVQVNDAVLLHHESFSRGNDTAPEKKARLAREMQRLYERYPMLRANDPFYSPNLVQWKKDVEYNISYLYACDRLSEPTVPRDGDRERKQKLLKKYDFRNALKTKGVTVSKIYDRLTGYNNLMLNIDKIAYDIFNEKTYFTIHGWCVVKNMDNADIVRKLWLIRETQGEGYGGVYEFDIMPKLREDVAAIFDGSTKNTALAGIQVIFDKDALEPGTYRVGVVIENKLVCDLEMRIEI